MSKTLNQDTWKKFMDWRNNQDKSWYASKEFKRWKKEWDKITEPIEDKEEYFKILGIKFHYTIHPTWIDYNIRLKELEFKRLEVDVLRASNGTFKPEMTVENCLQFMPIFNRSKNV